MITNVHAEVHCWGGKDVVCLRWDWNGKTRKNVYLGDGKHYSRPSGLSDEDWALIDGMFPSKRPTVAQAKAWLAAPENQALRESVRRAKG